MPAEQSKTAEDLARLDTEQRNPRTMELDTLPTALMVKVLHDENHTVPQAVDAALDELARLVDIAAERLHKGGRLIYIGAGTSGRLGILDASECPPTFGVTPDTVQGIIAGGDVALRSSIEGAEDDQSRGEADLASKNITADDVVVGIAASGRTPYVIGALKYARSKGAATAAIVNTSGSALSKVADVTLAAVTGPEPITGSTRMKAGTAQKLLLNLLSTGVMIKLGKVFGNLMVDVKATNIKLRDRAVRITQQATGASAEECSQALDQAGWHAKTAIVMILLQIPAKQASQLLEKSRGHIRSVLPAIAQGSEQCNE